MFGGIEKDGERGRDRDGSINESSRLKIDVEIESDVGVK
jgi:hypothetical protein